MPPRYLFAAGDPLQLPPVIASPGPVTPPPGAAPGAAHGLLRPLFVRLAALGHTPHLLRRQYRCHPDLAAVPNQLFYGGRLLDGCAAADRPSLLPGLPSLVFLDVRGSEQYNPGMRVLLPCFSKCLPGSASSGCLARCATMPRVPCAPCFRGSVPANVCPAMPLCSRHSTAGLPLLGAPQELLGIPLRQEAASTLAPTT